MNIRVGDMIGAKAVLNDEPIFQESKLLIVHIADDGVVGLIQNKQIGIGVSEILDGFSFEEPMYYGGPVGADSTLHYLHTFNHISETQEISEGVFWGGEFEEIKALEEEGRLSPNNMKFFVGYSGWSKDFVDKIEEGFEFLGPVQKSEIFFNPYL